MNNSTFSIRGKISALSITLIIIFTSCIPLFNQQNDDPRKLRDEYRWEKGTPNQSDKNARPLLMKMNNENVPIEKRIFGEGHYLRPNFIQLINCRNIRLEGFLY
ncbi:MAG: hypothetical protein KJ799_06160 [Bacteroidetes bacterium]|nr:hypothetical protein [Bacteroidota bacterium]MBU1680425.1 hypothetical protein [Bacteroidota bacterium]MBU2506292.1 hypothetical protein [Bacteroidota bacterium]